MTWSEQARSTQHCKSDRAPASIGSKVLQPPGAKSCWVGILQKQVNFVSAGFVLFWVYHLSPPRAGTEDGGSKNTTARDPSNLTEMGAYIRAPAGSVSDLVVSSSTSNECGTINNNSKGSNLEATIIITKVMEVVLLAVKILPKIRINLNNRR